MKKNIYIYIYIYVKEFNLFRVSYTGHPSHYCYCDNLKLIEDFYAAS